MIEDKRLECQMKFRLSTELKQQILNYCEKHSLNTSQFIRQACKYILNKGEKENEKSSRILD